MKVGKTAREPAVLAAVGTVYLRRHPGGWSVSLDQTLLHVSSGEAEAFAFALDAYRDAPEQRRMLMLSGPQTGPCPDPLHQMQGATAALV